MGAGRRGQEGGEKKMTRALTKDKAKARTTQEGTSEDSSENKDSIEKEDVSSKRRRRNKKPPRVSFAGGCGGGSVGGGGREEEDDEEGGNDDAGDADAEKGGDEDGDSKVRVLEGFLTTFIEGTVKGVVGKVPGRGALHRHHAPARSRTHT
jgi:hypothetical protein